MKLLKILSLALLLTCLFSVGQVRAEETDPNDDGGLLLPTCPTDKYGTERCGVSELIGANNSLLHNLINFLLLYLAIPLATLSIAIAGFKFILSGSDPHQRESAKKIFWYAFIGLVIAFAAWLIVDTILEALVDKTTFNPPLDQTK